MPPPVPPWWRRAYDTVEKPLGDALASGAQSATFADVMALAVRVPRRVQRELERRTRHALHFANLPSATDVRRLTGQVTELQRDMRVLSHKLEEPRPAPKKAAAPRKPPAKR